MNSDDFITTMSLVTANLSKIMDQVNSACYKSGRSVTDVQVLAISKKQSFEIIDAAFQAGVICFGENYMQEAIDKMPKLNKLPIDWHFVGSLQSNKAKDLVKHFSLFHALDRMSLIKSLSKAAGAESRNQDCLIQVNLENEQTKGGIRVAEGPAFLEAIQRHSGLRVRGLMVMPPRYELSIDRHRVFAKLRELSIFWGQYLDVGSFHQLRELSMGTSEDFIEAVCEGATILRLGTALLGARNR